jgi:hypothetical protein
MWPRPTASPAGSAAGSPESGRRRRLPTPGGPIASPSFFLGCLVQTEGIVVKVGKDLGALVQNGNFNSIRVLLILVNALESRRKFGKLQIQF